MADIELHEKNRTYHIAQSSMEYLQNYYSWTYGKFLEYISGEVIELGSGAGLGISNYIEQAKHVYAVDHDEELLSRVSQRYPGNKVIAVKENLLGDWGELSNIHADVIIMMDVLEHFRDDQEFIVRVARLLMPGGHILVKVPAQSKLYSEIDKASGHFRRYDKDRLYKLGEKAELVVECCKSINPFGAIAYRLKKNKKSNFSRTFSVRQLKVINYLIPVISRFDNIPLLPGMSWLCVYKRE